MMNTKNLVILAVVLAVLLGVNLMQRSDHKKATRQSSVVELIAADIVPDDLSRITVGYGPDSEAVIINNTPTGWLLETAWGAKANPARIETLVRNVAGLTGEYRSDNAAVLADYGLDEAGALTIRAYNPAGEEVVAIDVGRKPERYPGNFVRQPQNNKVYVSQKNLLAQVGIYGDPETPQNRYFLELQALQEDRLEVDRMVISGTDQVLDFTKIFAVNPPAAEGEQPLPEVDRTTWEWKLAGAEDTSLAKTKVDAVLNSLVAVRAADLADPGADLAGYGLANPTRAAALHLQDGRVLKLTFGATREAVDDIPAGTYMQLEGSQTVWVVTEYATKNIFKELGELQPE